MDASAAGQPVKNREVGGARVAVQQGKPKRPEPGWASRLLGLFLDGAPPERAAVDLTAHAPKNPRGNGVFGCGGDSAGPAPDAGANPAPNALCYSKGTDSQIAESRTGEIEGGQYPEKPLPYFDVDVVCANPNGTEEVAMLDDRYLVETNPTPDDLGNIVAEVVLLPHRREAMERENPGGYLVYGRYAPELFTTSKLVIRRFNGEIILLDSENPEEGVSYMNPSVVKEGRYAGLIVFEKSYTDGRHEVWTADLKKRQIRPIGVQGAALQGIKPVVSPGGEQLAYVAGGKLYVTTDLRTGADARELELKDAAGSSITPQDMAWTPDGKQLVLSLRIGSGIDLYVYTLSDESTGTFKNITARLEVKPKDKETPINLSDLSPSVHFDDASGLNLVAFVRHTEQGDEIAVISLDDGAIADPSSDGGVRNVAKGEVLVRFLVSEPFEYEDENGNSRKYRYDGARVNWGPIMDILKKGQGSSPPVPDAGFFPKKSVDGGAEAEAEAESEAEAEAEAEGPEECSYSVADGEVTGHTNAPAGEYYAAVLVQEEEGGNWYLEMGGGEDGYRFPIDGGNFSALMGGGITAARVLIIRNDFDFQGMLEEESYDIDGIPDNVLEDLVREDNSLRTEGFLYSSYECSGPYVEVEEADGGAPDAEAPDAGAPESDGGAGSDAVGDGGGGTETPACGVVPYDIWDLEALRTAINDSRGSNPDDWLGPASCEHLQIDEAENLSGRIEVDDPANYHVAVLVATRREGVDGLYLHNPDAYEVTINADRTFSVGNVDPTAAGIVIIAVENGYDFRGTIGEYVDHESLSAVLRSLEEEGVLGNFTSCTECAE